MHIRLTISVIMIAPILIMIAPRNGIGQYTDSMGGSFNNALSASASTMIWSSIFNRIPGAASSGTRTAPTSRSTTQTTTRASPPQKITDQRALKFRPTGSYLTTAQMADQLGNTQAEREQYAKLMNAVLDAFNARAQTAGLQNDLAAALAFFLGENIRIYRGLPEIPDQKFIDLRNLIANAVIETGALNTSTDRQKQEMFEALVAYTGITQYTYEQGMQAGNGSIVKGAQKVAGNNLRMVTKMSPDELNFDPNNLPSETNSESNTQPALVQGGGPKDIYQLRHDYDENAVRADQIYKGKRFLFVGTVVEVSGMFYKTVGKDPTGRYIYNNIGPNLRVTNTAGTVIGWDVHVFFRDKNQLAALRERQSVKFEATVEGAQEGSTTLILKDAVLR